MKFSPILSFLLAGLLVAESAAAIASSPFGKRDSYLTKRAPVKGKAIPVSPAVNWYCGKSDGKPATGTTGKDRPALVTFHGTTINKALTEAVQTLHMGGAGRYPAAFRNRLANGSPMLAGAPASGLYEFPIMSGSKDQGNYPGAFRIIFHDDKKAGGYRFIGVTEHPASARATTIGCSDRRPAVTKAGPKKQVKPSKKAAPKARKATPKKKQTGTA